MGARGLRDFDDEPTCVGAFSREEIERLMREADEAEAHRPRVVPEVRAEGAADSPKGRRMESGIQAKGASDSERVTVPRLPALPEDLEHTIVGASHVPPSPALDMPEDEVARILDFDWDAPESDGDHAPFPLHNPTERMIRTSSAPPPPPVLVASVPPPPIVLIPLPPPPPRSKLPAAVAVTVGVLMAIAAAAAIASHVV